MVSYTTSYFCSIHLQVNELNMYRSFHSYIYDICETYFICLTYLIPTAAIQNNYKINDRINLASVPPIRIATIFGVALPKLLPQKTSADNTPPPAARPISTNPLSSAS